MPNSHMQRIEFNLISILQHASRWHGQQEVVTNSVEGGLHRTTYSEIYSRTKKLANALTALGVSQGDRIGTMAWNTWRHLECWYGIGGIGAICHTLNPRLFPNQIEYIVNHAEDTYIFVDITFLTTLVNVLDKLPSLKGLIVLTDAANMPDVSGINIPVHCYEDLIAAQEESYDWPSFDEDTASSLCYTSGTTGEPKGVLYSHRSNIIHAMATSGGEVFNIGPLDSALMIVPMFHANSWGLAFSVPMVGAKLVMAGPHMDGESVHSLITNESVTMSAAVPTVWTGLLQYMEAHDLKVSSLKETVIGGSAVPRSMFETFRDKYDVDVIHAWGMTEMSPVGSVNRVIPAMKNMDLKTVTDLRIKQGRAVYGVDMKIVDDADQQLQHDGKASGRLMVKGHWVIEKYYKTKTSALDGQGWLDTGDIASIDAHGFMQITDRSKDLIKSGGEWISSVDIENSAVGHPDLTIAACIGIQHPKWEERPLLIAVKKLGQNPTIDSIKQQISREHAKWQVPDDVIFISEMPLTATGKIDKKVLRAQYSEHYL